MIRLRRFPFQIENYVKSKEDRDRLDEVVDMQISVKELFVQAEREFEFDSGYNQGKKEGKDEVILNMLNDSVDDETILKFADCSEEHLQEIKAKYLAGK